LLKLNEFWLFRIFKNIWLFDNSISYRKDDELEKSTLLASQVDYDYTNEHF